MREIREQLWQQAEPDYARFAASLLRKPGEAELSGSAARVLGVRLPALRRMAAGLARADWSGNLGALEEAVSYREAAFEEIMLYGFLIGRAPKTIPMEERFALVREFVAYIDNWSLCDSFCASLKFAKDNREAVWDFLQPFLHAKEEYSVRFGLVMLLDHFITEDYIARLFSVFDSVCHRGYYVQMANAWAISVCFVHFPGETMAYLEQNQLDDFTYNKALQKITESNRVAKDVKERIRRMRR